MNHTEAAQYIKATITAFGPSEAISMTKETWAKIHEAMQALAQPEQKPVAWIYEDELPEGYPYDEMFENSRVIEGVRMFPVNVAPQRTWQGLTDEEVGHIADDYSNVKSAIKAAEAKLKAKNA